MNTTTDTLSLIIEHGLSVRQIPRTVTSRFSYREGQSLQAGEKLVERGGRTLVQRVRVPVNAGRWMAKVCAHSDTNVNWSLRTDPVCDTLEEAVNQAVATLQAERVAVGSST